VKYLERLVIIDHATYKKLQSVLAGSLRTLPVLNSVAGAGDNALKQLSEISKPGNIFLAGRIIRIERGLYGL
jgi:hypothetical protein